MKRSCSVDRMRSKKDAARVLVHHRMVLDDFAASEVCPGLVSALHCGPVPNGKEPALEIGQHPEIDLLPPCMPEDPWKAGHVDDRIVPGHELAPLQPAVKHCQQA